MKDQLHVIVILSLLEKVLFGAIPPRPEMR